MSARSGVPLVALVAACAVSGSGAADTTADTAQFAADLAALTAPAMEGREPGTPGGLRAERHLAARFAELGLAATPGAGPAADPDAYRHGFDVDVPGPGRVDPTGTALRVELRAGVVAWRPGEDFVPFGFSPDGAAAGPLAFAGHALSIPELGRGDLADLDLRGAVVLVLRGAPGWRDPGSPFRSHAPALRFARKIADVAARGAVAVLVADPESPDDPAAARAAVARAAVARGDAAIPAVWLTWPAARQLLAELGRGPDDLRPSRVDRRVELTVRFAERRERRRTANVVGWLQGSDPDLRRQVVVVGAHHDHIGRGAFGAARGDAVGRIHPGADDNASGCAGLLLVARQLVRGPRPRRSVCFVAFAAEEWGRLGSEHLLDAGDVDPARVVAMVNLNMIGRASADRLRVEGVGSGAGLAALVAAAGAEVGREPALRPTATSRSDHATFAARGIPALHVHGGVHADYHTPDDVAERVLVADAVRAARLAAGIVERLADLRARPAFTGGAEPRAPR